MLQVPTASTNAPNRLPVQFYPRWDLRPPFSQKIFRENPKIQKNPKNVFGHYLNPSRKKKRDLNRISLTLSNRCSLISVCSLTLSNRFLLRPSAPDMRITPDLHHLSSKKITPHIPWKNFGLPFSNFPLYLFKVADLRFNTFLDTYGTIRQCCRSPRPLEMLLIDYPSNASPDGTFAPIFAKDLQRKSKKSFRLGVLVQIGVVSVRHTSMISTAGF